MDCCKAEGGAAGSVSRAGNPRRRPRLRVPKSLIDNREGAAGLAAGAAVAGAAGGAGAVPAVGPFGAAAGAGAVGAVAAAGAGLPASGCAGTDRKDNSVVFPLRISAHGIVTLTSSVLPAASAAGAGPAPADGAAAGAAVFPAAAGGVSRRTTAALEEMRRSIAWLPSEGTPGTTRCEESIDERLFLPSSITGPAGCALCLAVRIR